MGNSLNFNSIDLADYGLIVNNSNIPTFKQIWDSQLIQDKSYGFKPKRPPKILRFDVTVLAATRAILDNYLDNIKLATTTEITQALKVDILDDRYWNAKKASFDGGYRAAGMWQGIIIFQADDPMAYGDTILEPFSHNHIINAAEDTIIETPGGTGYILPVWTLTPGEDRTATIKLKNLTTDEEFQWTGTVSNGHDLVINSTTWHVTDNAVDSMAEIVAGSVFPRLAPNMANSIKVTALYNAVDGNLNITYRNRYL